ncbi:hypothetical protein A5906_05275 [Bradyrhizobium sacchari]|uniref:Phasin protein n=1 Tax=Bradyrhizobium sacchari TaxID=1399419 RepID=A0A560JEN8_9BRAD|nr:hypothetical protein [Bradyrhizobium sacchari]OPY95997.1 hypothetical protein A5906_05275 [Bradyrhizobium sacchari]TWB51271.1 hypothetical protein FBZ94_110101 [Bradyrhizobium sacchari]TWB69505.1 hypothetical protein FBZ95_109101 [Bradyrhizobium sacchari]
MPANASENEKHERRPHVGPEPALASAASADGAGKFTTAAARIPFTFREWQSSIEATSNLFARALKDELGLTASIVHDQATFLKNVADSKTPAELLSCHLDLLDKFWSRSFSAGSKILDYLKPQPSPAGRQAIH